MKAAGAEVEVAYAQKLKIGPCLSCLSCITKTPGQCVQKDDMEEVFMNYAFSDGIVWATPIGMDLNIEDIFQAANEAGQQFVRDGRIADETLSIVSRKILPKEDYFQAFNQFIEEERKKNMQGE
jgi:hypothetical protein